MNALLLSALLLLGQGAQDSGHRVDLEAQTSNIGVPLARPDLYDGLMVATVLTPAVRTPRPDYGLLAMQRVRVEDSRAFAPGTVVDIYFELAGGGTGDGPDRALAGLLIDQEGAMPVGARVLLLARAAQNGVLRLPRLEDWDVPEYKSVALGSPAPAALGEAFFLTARARLANAAEPRWRYVESLAQAIPGTDDTNAVRVTDFMRTFQGRTITTPFGRPDDRLSKTFLEAVANDIPYHRALVNLALNRLYYWGSGDRFYVDLRAAADDPNAFPQGVPYLPFWEQVGNGNNNSLPKGFKHTSGTTWEEHRSILRHSKSPTISAWLLQNMPKPSDADVRAMARFLDSPDPRLRRAFVERLAFWNGFTPPEEPKEVREEGETRTVYPGLNEAVAFWKAKLQTPASAP